MSGSDKIVLAEGVGFEPTIRLPVYTLSKRAPSATRPSLRVAGSRREYRCRRPAQACKRHKPSAIELARCTGARLYACAAGNHVVVRGCGFFALPGERPSADRRALPRSTTARARWRPEGQLVMTSLGEHWSTLAPSSRTRCPERGAALYSPAGLGRGSCKRLLLLPTLGGIRQPRAGCGLCGPPPPPRQRVRQLKLALLAAG